MKDWHTRFGFGGGSGPSAQERLYRFRQRLHAQEDAAAFAKQKRTTCGKCGAVLTPLLPGTMVESSAFGDYKIGPVASGAVVRAYADKYRSFVGTRVPFIDIRSGALCFRERTDVRVVQGHIHIDRRF